MPTRHDRLDVPLIRYQFLDPGMKVPTRGIDTISNPACVAAHPILSRINGLNPHSSRSGSVQRILSVVPAIEPYSAPQFPTCGHCR